MTKNIFRISAIVLLGTLLITSGCLNQEEKARELYNEALVSQRSGDPAKAIALYNKIVTKYPSTEVAVNVNEMLAGKEMVEKVLTDATRESEKSVLESAVKLYVLDNGKCPTTDQGLQALVKPPATGRLARNWRAGGYLKDPSILDLVDSYSGGPGAFDFEIIMK